MHANSRTPQNTDGLFDDFQQIFRQRPPAVADEVKEDINSTVLGKAHVFSQVHMHKVCNRLTTNTGNKHKSGRVIE